MTFKRLKKALHPYYLLYAQSKDLCYLFKTLNNLKQWAEWMFSTEGRNAHTPATLKGQKNNNKCYRMDSNLGPFNLEEHNAIPQ
jgi:hypothetical protein